MLYLFLACVKMCLWCENGDLGPYIDAVLAHFPACNPEQTYQSFASLRMYLWKRTAGRAGGKVRREPDCL